MNDAKLLATTILGEPLGHLCERVTVEPGKAAIVEGFKGGDVVTFHMASDANEGDVAINGKRVFRVV